jgi:hypothetical protein
LTCFSVYQDEVESRIARAGAGDADWAEESDAAGGAGGRGGKKSAPKKRRPRY